MKTKHGMCGTKVYEAWKAMKKFNEENNENLKYIEFEDYIKDIV